MARGKIPAASTGSRSPRGLLSAGDDKGLTHTHDADPGQDPTTPVDMPGYLRAMWANDATTRVYGPEAHEAIRGELRQVTGATATEPPHAPTAQAEIPRAPATELPFVSHASTTRATPKGHELDHPWAPDPPSSRKASTTIRKESLKGPPAQLGVRLGLVVILAFAALLGGLRLMRQGEPAALRAYVEATISSAWSKVADVAFNLREN